MATDMVKLSFQAGSEYKKCIGSYLSNDGSLKPKTFWLGSDKSQAEERASVGGLAMAPRIELNSSCFASKSWVGWTVVCGSPVLVKVRKVNGGEDNEDKIATT